MWTLCARLDRIAGRLVGANTQWHEKPVFLREHQDLDLSVSRRAMITAALEMTGNPQGGRALRHLRIRILDVRGGKFTRLPFRCRKCERLRRNAKWRRWRIGYGDAKHLNDKAGNLERARLIAIWDDQWRKQVSEMWPRRSMVGKLPAAIWQNHYISENRVGSDSSSGEGEKVKEAAGRKADGEGDV